MHSWKMKTPKNPSKETEFEKGLLLSPPPFRFFYSRMTFESRPKNLRRVQGESNLSSALPLNSTTL